MHQYLFDGQTWSDLYQRLMSDKGIMVQLLKPFAKRHISSGWFLLMLDSGQQAVSYTYH